MTITRYDYNDGTRKAALIICKGVPSDETVREHEQYKGAEFEHVGTCQVKSMDAAIRRVLA